MKKNHIKKYLIITIAIAAVCFVLATNSEKVFAGSSISITDLGQISFESDIQSETVTLTSDEAYQVYSFTTDADGTYSYTIYASYIDSTIYDSAVYLCTADQYESICSDLTSISGTSNTFYNISSTSTYIARDDDGDYGYNFTVTAILEPNTTYYIVATKYSMLSSGSFQLNVLAHEQISLDNQSANSVGTSAIYGVYDSDSTLYYLTEYCDGDVATSITVPTKTNATFAGYYTEEDGEGTQIIDADGNILDAIDDISGCSTIYAYWIMDQYTVTVENGSGDNDYDVDSTVEIIADDPEEGYEFSGWEVTSGSASLADSTSSTTTFTMPAGDVTVTAEYTAIDYSVTVNNGTSDSDTSTIGSTVEITADDPEDGYEFSGWEVTSGSVELADTTSATTTFTMTAEDVTVTAVYSEIEPGTVEKTSSGDSEIAAALSDSISKLKEILLTDDELERVENGESISIDLEVEDAEDSITEEDMALVESALNGYTIGQYLDINLYKTIGSDDTQQITETDEVVTVTITIPEDLINTDSSVTRTYKIIRVHDGETTVITGTYNAETNEFTFETDKFSSYTLVYLDTESDTDDSDTETTESSSPETGDYSDINMYSVIGIIAIAVGGSIILIRKNQNNEELK